MTKLLSRLCCGLAAVLLLEAHALGQSSVVFFVGLTKVLTEQARCSRDVDVRCQLFDASQKGSPHRWPLTGPSSFSARQNVLEDVELERRPCGECWPHRVPNR
jgi:hypothetical protein